MKYTKEAFFMEKLDKNLKPDLRLAAICGLYCPSCSAFIGNKEEPARLDGLAARLHRTTEELRCNGCRSDKLSFFCTVLCKMKPCAQAKGVTFCVQCEEYPCEILKEFQAAAPHRIELRDSLEKIKAEGMEAWFRAMNAHFSCPSCGVLNSAYDLNCRACGASPSCEYVACHKEAIVAHLAKTSAGK